MSIAFKSAGSKATNPLTPDPNPNVTPPANARILELPDRAPNGRLTTGCKFYPRFVTPAAPEIDITVWIFDEAQDTWVRSQVITGIGDNQGVQIDNIGPARLFFQYVLLSAGTADSAEVFAAPI